MEQKNVKIFYKPIDGGELKEVECVAESDGFEFEPLEEPMNEVTQLLLQIPFRLICQLTMKMSNKCLLQGFLDLTE